MNYQANFQPTHNKPQYDLMLNATVFIKDWKNRSSLFWV